MHNSWFNQSTCPSFLSSCLQSASLIFALIGHRHSPHSSIYIQTLILLTSTHLLLFRNSIVAVGLWPWDYLDLNSSHSTVCIIIFRSSINHYQYSLFSFLKAYHNIRPRPFVVFTRVLRNSVRRKEKIARRLQKGENEYYSRSPENIGIAFMQLSCS